MRPSAHTRVFAVLGNPVAHSLSPRMHNAGFLAAGIDAVYVALAVDAAGVSSLMHALVMAGGGGNVTVPHKQVAAASGHAITARVARLGAGNAFGMVDSLVTVENTDVDGVLAAVDRLGVTAQSWCVLGTGGSARAVVEAARERGTRVAVRSRSAERQAAFVQWMTGIGVETAGSDECDLVLNATPLGLGPHDALPVDLATLPAVVGAVDLTYRADGPTAWVRRCHERGVAACDGRETLLVQGAASWRLWFPEVSPPLEVMRAALDGRLG
jgi:shikimate dehydrogenase